MILSLITASTLLVTARAEASPEQPQTMVEAAKGFHLDGATFVRTSRMSGYYVIAPGSSAIDALGLQDVPLQNSDNISRNGVGADAIAFRFGVDGRLEGYPMYISQASPETFYTTRLAQLATNRTTLAEVQALFESHTIHVEKKGARTVAYLEVPVYDSNASGE